MLRLNPTFGPIGRARLATGLVAGLLCFAALGGQGTALAQVPGPESFAKAPTTPLEYWDAADYLVRTGQARLAVPYLNAFLKANPSDADLLRIRERYGVGSVLRLDEHPETRAIARPVLDLINAAVKRNATDPARIERFIDLLTKSREEQHYGVDRLRESGPYAVPALIRRISDPALGREDRALIVGNMGRLDTAAVPALIAALGAPDRTVGADAANALGRIGDPRAIPFLTYPAASREATPLRDSAQFAIQALTGRPFAAQPRTPVRVLTDEAWRYHRHQVRFGSDPTELWVWEGDAPAPRSFPVTAAESVLGGRLAREALMLDPADRSAQVVLTSLALEKAAQREGIGPVSGRDPTGAFAAAMASGPDVLTDVLKTAIADGHGELAAVAALALGRVAGRDAAGAPDRIGPLVGALSAPDRRVQYAAASALVDMNPSRPFVGSSRVVPILARFVANSAARALVIDGNLSRGNSVAASLKGIGYDTSVATSGPEGFREAAESADVEVILINPEILQGPWTTNDTLTNLRADSRTAGIPVFLYGPLSLRDRLNHLLTSFPRVGFVVTPTAPNVARDSMGRQLNAMGTHALSDQDRAAFAQGAAGLLATVASRPNSPFAANLSAAEPALARALDVPASALNAAVVLANVPGADAQRNLARVAMDGGRPAPLRFEAARALARSIQRFGPLLTPEQEKGIVDLLASEPDAAIRGALASVHGALRPAPAAVGSRLQAFQPAPPPAPPSQAPDAKPADAEAKPANEAAKPEGDVEKP